MTHYENSIVYQLKSTIDDSFYIGSTSHPKTRYSMHVSASKEARNANRPLYVWANDVGWNNIYMTIIEKLKCNGACELAQREKYFIEFLQPDLNSHMPGQSEQELKESRKESQIKFSMTQKYKDYKLGVSARKLAIKNKMIK